uniref:Leukocyte receptor cluster member 9 n=1 Tax=Varanus komodoensis TaxID=61221 RepID=A0A8D2LIM1_VARKO
MAEQVLSPEEDPPDLSCSIPVEASPAPDPDPTKHSSTELGPPCCFFLEGRCRFGARCWNPHPGDNPNLEDHSPTCEPSLQQPANKKPAMKTAEDVISRLLWDNQVPAEHFTIGYLDRFLGILEEPFSAFSWEDLASAGPGVLAIPKHRIQYFKYRSRIVWDKVSRTDDIFGSTGSGKTILEVVKEEEEAMATHGHLPDGSKREVMRTVGQRMAQHKGDEIDPDGSASGEGQQNRTTGEQEVTKGLLETMDNLKLAGDTHSTLDRSTVSKEMETINTIRDGHSIKDMSTHVHSIKKGNDPIAEEEVAALENRKPRHFPHLKQRPTHFVAIPVTSPEIREVVKCFQGALCEACPDLANFCVPLAALHVTLCLLHLHTPEEIYKATTALRELQASNQRLLPPALFLSFHQVETFHSHVLYMASASAADLGLLARTLEGAFSKKDLTIIHPPDKEKFHLTMVKIPPGKAGPQLPQDSSWIPTVENLGTQAVQELCLCEARKGCLFDWRGGISLVLF